MDDPAHHDAAPRDAEATPAADEEAADGDTTDPTHHAAAPRDAEATPAADEDAADGEPTEPGVTAQLRADYLALVHALPEAIQRSGPKTQPQYRLGPRRELARAPLDPQRPIAEHSDPRKAIHRAAKLARVPVPTRHGMRHWFCSASLALGVPVTTVREWLGHSAVSVTDIYAHALAPSEAVRALLDLVGPHTRG